MALNRFDEADALQVENLRWLRDLDGLDSGLIPKLADAGVHTRDDLADLAIDELTDITGQSAEDAKTLILKAREHWFASQE